MLLAVRKPGEVIGEITAVGAAVANPVVVGSSPTPSTPPTPGLGSTWPDPDRVTQATGRGP